MADYMLPLSSDEVQALDALLKMIERTQLGGGLGLEERRIAEKVGELVASMWFGL